MFSQSIVCYKFLFFPEFFLFYFFGIIFCIMHLFFDAHVRYEYKSSSLLALFALFSLFSNPGMYGS